eukprot:7386588-Prymnesium_polylepis.3
MSCGMEPSSAAESCSTERTDAHPLMPLTCQAEIRALRVLPHQDMNADERAAPELAQSRSRGRSEVRGRSAQSAELQCRAAAEPVGIGARSPSAAAAARPSWRRPAAAPGVPGPSPWLAARRRFPTHPKPFLRDSERPSLSSGSRRCTRHCRQAGSADPPLCAHL